MTGLLFCRPRGRVLPLFLVLVLSVAGIIFLAVPLFWSQGERVNKDFIYGRLLKSSLLEEDAKRHVAWKSSCRFHTCFEINNCSIGIGDQISVYVYPDIEFTVEETKERLSSIMSIEYRELITAVKNSPYYQPNASEACVFVPPIDTLSQDLDSVRSVSLMLHALPQ